MSRATRNQYADMSRMCGESNNIHVNNKMGKRILLRLCKKYGMKDISIRFFGHRDSGSASTWRNEIRMSNDPSIYLIMHEFAHIAQHSQFFREKLVKITNIGTNHHGLHYEIVLNHVNQFCKASNYFEKMRNRTRKVKTVKQFVDAINSVCDSIIEAKTECITPEVNIVQ